MGWLLSFIPFLSNITNAIQSITNKIVDLRIIQAQAATDQERIHADEDIKVLEAQRDILIKDSETGAYITNLVRIGLVLPVAFLLWKLLLWDKGVGSLMGCSGDTTGMAGCVKFTTDKLDGNLWWVIFAVVCFYFTQSLATIWKRPA